MRKVTKHNIVAQTSFSDRLAELMRQYTKQHLSSAEITKIRSTIKRLLAKVGLSARRSG
jgi:hypothetical protein